MKRTKSEATNHYAVGFFQTKYFVKDTLCQRETDNEGKRVLVGLKLLCDSCFNV